MGLLHWVSCERNHILKSPWFKMCEMYDNQTCLVNVALNIYDLCFVVILQILIGYSLYTNWWGIHGKVMEGLAFRLQPVLVLLYMSAQGRGSIHLYDYSISHVHICLMPTIATCNVINDLMLWLQAEIIGRHLQACMPICSVPTITNCDIIINGLMV